MSRFSQTLNKITQVPAETDEVRYKGVVFNYFVGVVWLVTFFLLLRDIYLALTLSGAGEQEYLTYVSTDLLTLIILAAVFWLHRRYPEVARHLFIFSLSLIVLFLFPPEDADRIMVAYTLPIIMAAFLIRPLYSFVYLLLIIGGYIYNVYTSGGSVLDQSFNFPGLVVLVIISVVAWLIASSLERALSETRALNRELDQRVQDRTKELAETLRREHTLALRNKTILESIADGVLVFSADQEVVMANPAANRFAKRDLNTLSLTGFLNTIDEKARKIIQPWLSSKKPEDIANVRFEWHERTISANVAPVILPGSDDEHIGGGNVMVLRDFTHEAQLERAKDLFLGMVSHELRTPMAAIQGYVDLLLATEKDNLTEAGHEYLQTINISIKELLQLANELIDLSRMETGEVELYRQWVEVPNIVNGAVKIVRQEFTKRNLSLEVTIDDDLPELYLDRTRINQILLNLLSNAYKYTNKGGATVEVHQQNGWVNITVSDTGVGIKESDQQKLFDRFFRADDRTVQKAGGTGLGLSITKGLVELHGGTLTFESTYGEGTTFVVALPQNG